MEGRFTRRDSYSGDPKSLFLRETWIPPDDEACPLTDIPLRITHNKELLNLQLSRLMDSSLLQSSKNLLVPASKLEFDLFKGMLLSDTIKVLMLDVLLPEQAVKIVSRAPAAEIPDKFKYSSLFGVERMSNKAEIPSSPNELLASDKC